MRSIPAVTLLAGFAVAACSGSGEGLDANGRPVDGTGSQPLVAELSSIQDHVFTPICTACHTGAAAPLGFRLDADAAYAMLVNTPSVEVPSLFRVSPGNPDSSYIIQKLEGHAAVGGQMPLGQPPLPKATIDVIRQWISDGAQASAATQNVMTAPRLRAISPVAGEDVKQASGEIVVAADQMLDVSRLDFNNVTLLRSGNDDAFSEGSEVTVPVHIDIRSLSPTVLVLKPLNSKSPGVNSAAASAQQWAPGLYRLTIAGQGPLAAISVTGKAIDGAGNGVEGSDFVLQFNVIANP